MSDQPDDPSAPGENPTMPDTTPADPAKENIVHFNPWRDFNDAAPQIDVFGDEPDPAAIATFMQIVFGYFNAWPEYFHTFGDKVGQEPRMRRPRPGPREISEAEEALLWLRWLEKDDAQIVWLRANGRQWKPICWELGISRATANRRWQYGIAVIVWRLNGKRVPAGRSMQFVVSKADGT